MKWLVPRGREIYESFASDDDNKARGKGVTETAQAARL
jgi:hypothetical protein